MSRGKRLAYLLALSLGASTASGQAVMTFESLATPGTDYQSHPNLYTEAGFRVSASPGHFCFTQTPPGGTSPYWAGSTGFLNCIQNGITTLTKIGGGTFSLFSIDLAPFSASPPYGVGAPVTFVGTPVVGPPRIAAFNAPLTQAFQTYHFPGFDDLLSVSWQHVYPYHQFDNITLDVLATPEPSTVLLVGGGLLALAAARRRARTA